MTLQQIRYFLCIVREGTFEAASASTGVSVPAISQNLKRLEDYLGAEIIVRKIGRHAKDHHLKLTTMGEWFYPHAITVDAMASGIVSDFRALATKTFSSLSISASQTIGSYWLPSCLRSLMQQYADIDISVTIVNTNEALTRVQRLEDDIAIVEGELTSTELIAFPFRNDSLVLIAPPGTDDNMDLRSPPWVVRESGSGTRNKTNLLWAQLGLTPEQLITLNNNEAIVQSVAAGLGIALVPLISIINHLESGLITQIHHNIAVKRALNIVIRKNSLNHPLIRGVLKNLQSS